MKEDVKNMFAQITMPEETEKAISQAIDVKWKPKKKVSIVFAKSVAAAAAVLILMLTISPTARAAFNNRVVKYFFPGSDITIYEETNENGEVVGITAVDTGAPPFARMVNDRLYFVGNGEKIDITEEITEETPYYYTYLDDYGLTHYMAVGYSGSIDNYGIYEFIREEKEGMQEWEGWVTGTGRNFLDPETESRYPWVDIIWEDLNIPWPKPE